MALDAKELVGRYSNDGQQNMKKPEKSLQFKNYYSQNCSFEINLVDNHASPR